MNETRPTASVPPSPSAIEEAKAVLLAAGYRVDRVSTEEERARAWLQLHGRDIGVALDVFRPGRCSIPLDTLAHGLSMECRYAGQTRVFYPVAMHCVLGSFFFSDPLDGLDFLFHDASEGLGLRDLPAPVKRLPEMAFYRELEDALMYEVARQFGLRPRFWEQPGIKAIDERMLHAEQAELLARPPAGREWGYWRNRMASGARSAPREVTPAQAKRMWLLRVAELSELAGFRDLQKAAHRAIEDDLRDSLYADGTYQFATRGA